MFGLISSILAVLFLIVANNDFPEFDCFFAERPEVGIHPTTTIHTVPGAPQATGTPCLPQATILPSILYAEQPIVSLHDVDLIRGASHDADTLINQHQQHVEQFSISAHTTLPNVT